MDRRWWEGFLGCSPAGAPLGIAIVGGLLLSQVLTLFTTPVVYLALDKLTRPKRFGLPPKLS